MGYTERQFATSLDSISTYDSTSLSPGAYTGAATLSCNDVMTCCLVAVKGAGALVQSNAYASPIGSYSGTSLAFTANNTAGNCIIVSLEFASSFPVVTPTISDSQGNTYTQIQFGHPGGSGHFGGTWIAFGIAAGANTVTISLTGAGTPGSGICIAISEYVGGTSVDASQAGSQVGAGTVNLSVTTTSANDLLYLGIGIGSACAGSPSNVTGGNPLTPPVPPEAWLIVNEPTLGFTDRSSFLFMNGSQHSFNVKLRERGTANYTLVSDPQDPTSAPSSYEPTMGQPIYLYDQNIAGYTLTFAGLIQDFTIRWVGTTGLRYIDCTAVSLESVFDTVYAQPMEFVDQTCGAILTALYNAFEAGCPVTLGTVQSGAAIPLFNANLGDKLSDLFDQLATTSEFTWGVNPATQQLYFCLPTAIPAPFAITSANVLWDSISQKYDNADYRNRQAVKLSYDAFPHSEEFFAGPGASLDFTLMRPVEQVVGAYITTATCNTATASFSGQPSPGDTITIGPAQGPWQSNHIYGLNGVIVINGFVFQVTTAGTSGSTQPAGFLTQTVNGDTVLDNSVIWTCRGAIGISGFQNTYEFVSTLDNTQFGQVLIGATVADTVQNLVDCLNAKAPYGGTPATNGKGLTFSLPTWENSQINAIGVTGTGFTAQQKIPGSGWIAGLTSTGSAFAWSSNVTTGGTSPQTSVGPNEGAWLSIAVYAVGTSTSAPGLGYTEGSAVVHLATPLNSGTNLTVEYTRTDGNVIEVEDTALVTALAAISHGTGKYQQATDQSSTGLISTSAAAGLQFAQQILATFDVTEQKFSLDFYRPGILPGQVLTLDLNSPLDVMNGSYLVLAIKGELVPTFPYLDNPNAPNAGHYKYTADLINVNLIGTDLAFWLGLGGGGSGGGSGAGGALVATSGSTGNTANQPKLAIQVNGTTASSQAVLNLANGTNTTVSDAGGGELEVNAPTMVGDSGSGGTAGVVPAPPAGSAAAGKFLKADGTFAVPPGTSSTPPGGSNPQVQYNNAGSFGGITGATSDGTNLLVTTQAQHDNSTKVASTAYTDLAVANAIAGVNPAVAVQAATTAAANTSGLAYNNGVGGVGATFTGTANTALTVDGFTFTTLGQRLLVKNDTQSPSGAFNGIYYVTQVQTTLLPPILTRALDYDQPSDINNTGAIPVVNGTVNATTSWLLTSAVTTVGTDPLTYVQFSANPSTLIVNPMTTKGDVIVGAASGVPARLAVGANGKVLTANSAATDGVDWEALPVATSSQLGLVEPDGTIITVSGGAITVAKATSSAFGVVEVDGTTITASGGVISAVGGGGFSPYSTAALGTPIVTGNWTTVGTGGVRTNLTGAINIVGNTGGSTNTNLVGVTTPVAAGNFTKYVVLWSNIIGATFAAVSVGFTDGTKFSACGLQQDNSGGNFGLQFVSGQSTAFSGSAYASITGAAASINGFLPYQLLIVRLSRTGTANKAEVSLDGGFTFVTIFNDTAPFLTANAIIVFADPRGAAVAPIFTLISYQ